eukprot:XP_003728395.1 PREDICTED: uncharacterized protein LOC100891046 isoform X2 [Strongylocentrotus purpuratus]
MGTLHCLCRLVVLLSLSVIRETVTSPNDQCQFIFKEDSVLQVALSQDAGAKVTMDLHAENKFKCAEACCESEGEWCTLAVFHTKTYPEAMNCFLVQCVPDGSENNVCITKHVRRSGFISATVKHHIPTPKPPTVQTTAKSSTKATTKPTAKAEIADTTPAPKWTSPVSLTASQMLDSNATQPINVTQSGQDGTESPGEIKHDNINRTTVTQTGILIVTLCFGIIFLLAMMVVVGKRWCEGYQRRKYSKVDYLINGYYS